MYILSMNTDGYLAPDIGNILDTMDEMGSPPELLTYLQEIPWNDVFTLYLPQELEDRGDAITAAKNDIVAAITAQTIEYNKSIGGKRAASLASYNTMFTTNLKFSVLNFLAERGITYTNAKEEREATIDTLKRQLLEHLKGGVEPYLYKMVVNETAEGISVRMQYTELGALIMWKTEIPHDLSALNPDILSMIHAKTMAYTPRLSNMYSVNGKNVHYTENIASELCLTILNYKSIPRCVQRHGHTELQFGERNVGHGLLPAIYNQTDVFLTSDANNTGNVEFGQVAKSRLTNITGKQAKLLKLDAGSAPTQIGFKEYFEYLAGLGALPDIQTLNKPVNITIYSPTGITMLNITSQDLEKYHITIYSDNGSETVGRELSNLSIQNVIGIVNSVDPKFKLPAALIKSLGDLVPYLLVFLLIALEHGAQHTNVVGSIDYSMIFQLLVDIRCFKDDQFKDSKDVTSILNQRTMLAGINMENSNTYFPWSLHERNVYKLLYAIYGKGKFEGFKDVKNELTAIISMYMAKNNIMSIGVYDYLMTTCIADFNTCQPLIAEYPNKDELITALKPFIDKLSQTTISEDLIKTALAHDEDEDEDVTLTVNFDKTDYVLAKLLAQNIPIVAQNPLILPIVTTTVVQKREKHTKPPSKVVKAQVPGALTKGSNKLPDDPMKFGKKQLAKVKTPARETRKEPWRGGGNNIKRTLRKRHR